jgi:hypothetical protein
LEPAARSCAQRLASAKNAENPIFEVVAARDIEQLITS